jgi:hypothetical protein
MVEEEQRDVIGFLREENRALKNHWSRDGCGWTMLNADDSRFMGQRLGRHVLQESATFVTRRSRLDHGWRKLLAA